MGIVTGPGSPQTFSSASGGKVYAFNNISTTPQQVIAGNPNRQKLTFHNPGTVDIFVAPATALNSSGQAVALVPTISLLGGCFRVFSNGGTLAIQGECQTAWQAFSASSSALPLTVMDSNL
jgi:hypothetical protein